MNRHAGDRQITFDDVGTGADGAPVVLLHPFPFDRRYWAGDRGRARAATPGDHGRRARLRRIAGDRAVRDRRSGGRSGGAARRARRAGRRRSSACRWAATPRSPSPRATRRGWRRWCWPTRAPPPTRPRRGARREEARAAHREQRQQHLPRPQPASPAGARRAAGIARARARARRDARRADHGRPGGAARSRRIARPSWRRSAARRW